MQKHALLHDLCMCGPVVFCISWIWIGHSCTKSYRERQSHNPSDVRICLVYKFTPEPPGNLVWHSLAIVYSNQVYIPTAPVPVIIKVKWCAKQTTVAADSR